MAIRNIHNRNNLINLNKKNYDNMEDFKLTKYIYARTMK